MGKCKYLVGVSACLCRILGLSVPYSICPLAKTETNHTLTMAPPPCLLMQQPDDPRSMSCCVVAAVFVGHV